MRREKSQNTEQRVKGRHLETFWKKIWEFMKVWEAGEELKKNVVGFWFLVG